MTGESTWAQENAKRKARRRTLRRVRSQAKQLEKNLQLEPTGRSEGWLVWQLSLIVVFCLGLLVGKHC